VLEVQEVLETERQEEEPFFGRYQDGSGRFYTHIIPNNKCGRCEDKKLECLTPIRMDRLTHTRGTSCQQCRDAKVRCPSASAKDVDLDGIVRYGRVVRYESLCKADRDILAKSPAGPTQEQLDGLDDDFGSDMEERVAAIPLKVQRYIQRRGLGASLAHPVQGALGPPSSRHATQRAVDRQSAEPHPASDSISSLRTDLEAAYGSTQARLTYLEEQMDVAIYGLKNLHWNFRDHTERDWPVPTLHESASRPVLTFAQARSALDTNHFPQREHTLVFERPAGASFRTWKPEDAEGPSTLPDMPFGDLEPMQTDEQFSAEASATTTAEDINPSHQERTSPTMPGQLRGKKRARSPGTSAFVSSPPSSSQTLYTLGYPLAPLPLFPMDQDDADDSQGASKRRQTEES